jgi:hypothetical protein
MAASARPAAQQVLTAADFARIQGSRLPAETSTESMEWIVRLPDGDASAQPSGAAPARAAVLGRLPAAQPIVRERDPGLSGDRLVVIAEAGDGTVADWRIVPDPRVLRSEQPDAAGLLSGVTLQQ